MKKIINIFLILSMLFACLYTVGASFSISQSAPAEYATLTGRSVNFSVLINNSDNAETAFNVTIYNRSSSTNNYSITFGNMTALNNTMINYSFEMTDNRRIWWYVNVTNNTGGPEVGDVRIFDIDTTYLVFQLGSYGAINFTLDTGDINTTGVVAADSFQFQLKDHTAIGDGCPSGRILYNKTLGHFLACYNNTWGLIDLIDQAD